MHDWNLDSPAREKPTHAFDFFDESLRDGVQSPSVIDPDIDDKLRILELMAALGIQSADIGLPGAGKRAFDDVVTMSRHVVKHKLPLELNCAGRTVVQDIRPMVEASQKAGVKLGVYAFIGSSPIRQWAENWDVEFIRKMSEEAIRFAVKEGLEVAYVTEDTTRSSPQALELLFQSAIEAGASRLVLCDTVGHATPDGTRALVRWSKALVERLNPKVKLDWHGHNDRGLAVVNAIAALEAGAHRLHGCGLGIGERVGNTSIDQLLLNLKLMGWISQDLTHLVEYVTTVSEATKVAIPVNYPLSGQDAFRTATGVHAAAIIKAKQKGDEWLADRVYSGVPAGEFGREQTIEIGHMSGMSNVRFWLAERRLPADEALCRRILEKAKSTSTVLTERQVRALVKVAPAKASGKRKSARPERRH
ncbi:MAG: 2-isopropylmalate synthase [Archangium sp.]|nr:2-isopropylmalate synthase [Archangium sp.]